MSKVIGIIPARWASVRFPGKPLHLIAGKPMLQHVWERACRAKTLDAVIVATDSMEIAEAAFAFGAEVALTSPKHPSGTDRIAEVAKHIAGAKLIVNIQGDEPMLDPKLVDRVVKAALNRPECGITTASAPFAEAADFSNPNVVKVVTDQGGCALYFSRAGIPCGRDAEPASALLRRHLGIYVFRRKTLLDFVRWKPSPLECTEKLEQLRALENGVRILVVPVKSATHGIDTPEDARKMEAALL